MTASRRPKTRISTSARQKSLTFTRNASATFGNDSRNRSPLKKNRRTSSQPGELTTTTATTATKTMVLTTAIVDAARVARHAAEDPGARPPGSASARAGWLGDSYSRTGALALSDSHSCWRLSSVPSSRSVPSASFTQSVSGLSLARTRPKYSCVADGRELADDLAVRHLDGGDEERRRKVDDDAVDLLRLEAGDGIVQRVVGRRLLARLHVLDDVVVARRPDRRAELRVRRGRRSKPRWRSWSS